MAEEKDGATSTAGGLPEKERRRLGAASGKSLSPEALRALEEAAARRAAADDAPADRPAEKGGPKGPDPTRYGDWERKGRAVDFS